MRTVLVNLFVVFILSSCANNDKPATINSVSDTPTVDSGNNKAANPESNYLLFDKDSITIQPFEIEIKLIPKAEERIKGKETIIVAVYFNGIPKDSSNAQLSEDGSFSVAWATKEIVAGQIAKFEGIKFSREIYDQLADKDVDCTVNIYSGRRSSPDNLLDANAIFEKISNIVNQRLTTNCKLIDEND
jgi:hypothetical protein